VARQLLDEPTLADSGLAADEKQTALAGERLVQTTEELA
jgi:hypothetical protein